MDEPLHYHAWNVLTTLLVCLCITSGRHIVVSCTRDLTWQQALLHRCWRLESRLHFYWNGYSLLS